MSTVGPAIPSAWAYPGDFPTSGWKNSEAPVMDYVYRIWIRSSIFEIHHLSDFITAIETSNDMEGWHNKLKTGVSTRGPVPFYHLVSVLHVEATDFSLSMKKVSEGRMQGAQMEGRVFSLWQQYCERNINASQLLQGCASIYRPPAQWFTTG